MLGGAGHHIKGLALRSTHLHSQQRIHMCDMLCFRHSCQVSLNNWSHISPNEVIMMTSLFLILGSDPQFARPPDPIRSHSFELKKWQ